MSGRKPEKDEHFLLAFESDWLRGVDLRASKDEEKEVRVTIAKVVVGHEVEGFKGGRLVAEKRIVIFFKDRKKALIANKTNCKLIAKALGTGAMDKWEGQQITLYTKWANWFGEYSPAIRVRTK